MLTDGDISLGVGSHLFRIPRLLFLALFGLRISALNFCIFFVLYKNLFRAVTRGGRHFDFALAGAAGCRKVGVIRSTGQARQTREMHDVFTYFETTSSRWHVSVYLAG